MTSSVLASLGAWAAALDHASIPADSLRAARFQVLDMVAAVHAASRSAETSSLGPGLEGFGGGGRCTVLPTGERRGPLDAALANAAYSMAQDYDDVVWMGHTCHSAVFAALAVAEHEGRGSRALLTAVVVANEVAGRIGASAALGPLNGQMWSFIHLVGAAAATARLLELDAERFTHALAIALSQPDFVLQPGFLSPSSKLLTAATPTAAGIRAAYFARAGMTGHPHIVEHPRGFWSRFSYLPLTPALGGLGRFWVMETLAIKTFPGCHYFQTACTATERLLQVVGPPHRIRSVRVDTTLLAVEVSRFARAEDRQALSAVNVGFDLGATVAILLHAGRLTGDEVRPAWLEEHEAAIRRLRERVQVRHAPEATLTMLRSIAAEPVGRQTLSAIGPRQLVRLSRMARRDYGSSLLRAPELGAWLGAVGRSRRRRRPTGLCFPSRVTIERVDGSQVSEQVDLPVGSLSAPGVEQQLRDKLVREVAPSLGRPAAERVLEVGMGLGDVALADLVDAATPPR